MQLPINSNLVNQNIETMSSSQLAEMLGFESKSSINKAIRKMFDDSKLESFNPSLDSRGYVVEYHLPELESKMFVAKHDINYLEKITQFWIDRNKPQPQALTQDQQLLQLAQGVIRLTAERDEAIRTKAQINDKRTATLMNRASQDAKRIKKLESQLQDTGNYLSLIAAKLPQRYENEFGLDSMTWRELVKISKEMSLPPKKVIDERFGQVNTYHIKVIAEFKTRYI